MTPAVTSERVPPVFNDNFVSIYHGDCREVMATLDADSVDAIVTDPPYGLGFMGREWDHGVPGEAFWREALRVAKPGCHLVAFGGTRTYHRLAVAIEDAGWEIRDCLGWLYGSGFPKSLDVSKAIDKEAGVEWDEFTPNPAERPGNGNGATTSTGWVKPIRPPKPVVKSDEAKAWQGWGTALKPAWEPIILARKPLCGTVARNVQTHSTGALNIDGCRVETDARPLREVAPLRDNVEYAPTSLAGRVDGSLQSSKAVGETTLGRWPANIVHDGSDEVLAVLGNQARFFYTAKATKAERDEGLYGEPCEYEHSGPRGHSLNGDGSPRPRPRRNFHPTVKPLDLMRWLVRLVTPPDGIVLDPFMGSGTTLKAARAEGHKSIGIDLEREHCDIAWGRLSQGVLL